MSQQALGFIEAIVIDVSDLGRSTQFWTAITGREFGSSFEPNFRRAKFECGPDLVLQVVPEVKSGKNRVHLDVEVSDRGEALQRVISMGGQLVADVGNEFGSLIVCADPDGNEFCLTSP